MPKKKFLLNSFKTAIISTLTILLTLSIDYITTKYFFNSILKWNFLGTLIGLIILESVTFIIVGFNFLQERIEQSREGYVGNAIMPDMARVPSLKIIHKARPNIGWALIVAGITLFILAIFILPSYLKLAQQLFLNN